MVAFVFLIRSAYSDHRTSSPSIRGGNEVSAVVWGWDGHRLIHTITGCKPSSESSIRAVEEEDGMVMMIENDRGSMFKEPYS